MEKEQIFQSIIKVFQKSFQIFEYSSIFSEGDWERNIFAFFREEFLNDLFTKYELWVEGNTLKYNGKNLLWISPKIYSKNINLINEFFELQYDETGEMLINIDNAKKPLNNKISVFIESQKSKTYKTDLILIDKHTKKRLFLIELKLGNNINNKVQNDYYKLKRSMLIKDPDAIYIAVGFDKANKIIYWEPTDKKYAYSFNLGNAAHIKQSSSVIQALQETDVVNILNETTKNVYKNFFYANEAFWSCELFYQLKKILPLDWVIHSEITGLFENSRDSLDLGLYHRNKLIYAIELKGHFEYGIPSELKNQMQDNKDMEAEFLKKANDFFKKYDRDSKIINMYKEYPKYNGQSFINPEFFGKIVEMYKQCKRMSSMISDGRIKKGYMVFGDHHDCFKSIKTKLGVTENSFLNNYTYRKKLIHKLLFPHLSKVDFIYFYGINNDDYTEKSLHFIQ